MATRVLGMEKKRFVGRVSYTVKSTKMRLAESKKRHAKKMWGGGHHTHIIITPTVSTCIIQS